MKFAKETNELFVTAGDSDRVYVITLKETYKFDIYFNDKKSKLNKKANSVSTELCVKMKSRPASGQKEVDVNIAIKFDSRLVNSQDQSEVFVLSKVDKAKCHKIERAINIFTTDCNWGAFKIDVINADMILADGRSDIYGSDFGCRTQLPRTEIQLVDTTKVPEVRVKKYHTLN